LSAFSHSILQSLEARVFGSRAKGTHERSSDIDLTLFGNISSQLLAQIAGELDELPLPYHFDVNNYASIRDLAVKAHIDRIAQPIYHRATQTPARS
jgi:predicted nucleotidyltransferase